MTDSTGREVHKTVELESTSLALSCFCPFKQSHHLSEAYRVDSPRFSMLSGDGIECHLLCWLNHWSKLVLKAHMLRNHRIYLQELRSICFVKFSAGRLELDRAGLKALDQEITDLAQAGQVSIL